MNNDNVYQPRGGYLPAEPEQQAVEREDEINKTLAAIPVLHDEVKYLDARIAFYESINAISDDVLLDANKFMHVVAANKLTAQNLTIERDALLGRIQEASKE
jgi:hypothetical protein